jgi:hypothetical protein
MEKVAWSRQFATQIFGASSAGAMLFCHDDGTAVVQVFRDCF